jgi:hypothetical protein
MIRTLLLILAISILIKLNINAQSTWQYIIENDTLAEAGQDVLELDDYLYLASSSRCQPNAQSCVMVRKFSKNGTIIWKSEFPDLRHSNENLIQNYKGNLILTGRKNEISDPQRHSFYEVDTAGNILDLTHINLPFESNLNYGSLIRGDTLFMYGTGREDVSEEGINVDALIVTYDLQKDTSSYEYFDYGHNFVDIWDMRLIEDGSILFYSRHSRQEYTGDSLDWVVERLWPDGHRTSIYNQPYNSEGGVSVPQMEYLGDGLIALLFPNKGLLNRFYPNIRIINLEGEVVLEKKYDYVKQNVFDYTADIRRTNDGDILICGRYYAEKINEEDLSSSANAYISKMTKDGTIEWLRHFRTEDEDGEPIWSGFSSMLSLSDNSIVAVGNIERSPSDLLIMKLDEDGCFSPDDCGGGVITDVEEVIKVENPSQIKVYPNPLSKDHPLRIELSNIIEINGGLLASLIDVNGIQVINQKILNQSTHIDISRLTNGIYFLKVIDDKGAVLTTRKLIVI